jgi:D-amino peptidase
MEGIDESFDAVVFIGYHAKAGTPDALLEHTTSGNVQDFTINGTSYPEAGYNALIAGSYGVPVVFVAGDRAICDQVRGVLGEVATFATKEGIGAATRSLHPDVSKEGIRAGVAEAVRNRARYRPYRLTPPYTLVLRLKTEESVYNGSFFPGAERTGHWELTFTSDDFLEVMYAYSVMRR